MPLVDVTASQWQSISASESITSTRWNALISDLTTLFNGGLDRANVTDGGLLPADMDGTAMTLANGSVTGNSGTQTVSRDTTFSGTLTESGTKVVTATLEDCTDTTPSVTDVREIFFTNATGSNVTITQLDDGVSGQQIRIVFNPDSAHDIVLQHGTDAGDFFLDGATDLTFGAAATRPVIIDLEYTTLNGHFTNAVWMEINRIDLA